MEAQVSWSRNAGVLVGSLAGRVDSANSVAFHDTLAEGVQDGEQALVLECGQLSYMSSAGLRVLLAMARKFQGPDQAIAMCGLTDVILTVVSLSGFDKIIPVHGSLADAIAAISGEGEGDAPGSAEAGGDYREAAGVPIPLQSPFNLDVVGDNIADVAAFTVEKHEFAHGDLPAGVRDEALTEIKDSLWKMFKRREERRQQLLAEAFRGAAKTLDEVLKRS